MTQDRSKHIAFSALGEGLVPDRRQFLMAAGAGLAAAAVPVGRASSQAQTAAPVPTGPDYIIRDAYVVTLDSLGDIPSGELHIRGGAIAWVGPAGAGPAAAGAQIIDATGTIAMPGMIDTHWHLWNTTLRNMQRAGKEYFPVKAAFVEAYEAEDHYRANRLSLVEAISGGISTVTNFAHNIQSPAHADAELRAMLESGIRGRYCYGWADPTPRDKPTNFNDIKRVASQWFGSSSPFQGRVDLGMAMRGFRLANDDVVAAEFQFAKEMGLPTIIHTGATKRAGQSVAALYNRGFIDSRTILAHWIFQKPADLEAAVKSGASVSMSPTSDLRTPYDASFHDSLFLLRKNGINLCLSLDSALLANISMFEQMAVTWYSGVPWYDTETESMPMFEFTDVLKMATENGAKALGIADKVGTLRAGKRADIVLVRATDANMVPLGEVHSALARVATVHNVDTVLIDGRILKWKGKLVGIDVETVVREAEESSDRLRRRAGGIWAPR
jgi:cytosine/adenosine deaminase-related metal-dependent hydrolase